MLTVCLLLAVCHQYLLLALTFLLQVLISELLVYELSLSALPSRAVSLELGLNPFRELRLETPIQRDIQCKQIKCLKDCKELSIVTVLA